MRAGIIGMGIMGCAIAEKLIATGNKVTIFEHDSHNNNCSIAAGGLLAPFSELDKSELIITKLGLESLQMHWPNILQNLVGPIDFHKLGSLVIYHPNDKALWHTFKNRIDNQLVQTCIQKLNSQQLKQLEPELDKFPEAYFFENEGHIDCQNFLNVIQTYLKDFICYEQARMVEPGVIKTTNRTYNFDWVFDCRGLKAKDVFPNLRGVRGELIWLYAPDVNIRRPIRLLHPRYSLYIVPRPKNIYLVGASEIESEDCSTISVRSTLELLTAVNYIHPGFIDAKIIKTVSQLRPTLSHHLPSIKYTKQLIAINGLYRHGYLIAPALANEVINFLFNKTNYPELWENYHD